MQLYLWYRESKDTINTNNKKNTVVKTNSSFFKGENWINCMTLKSNCLVKYVNKILYFLDFMLQQSNASRTRKNK